MKFKGKANGDQRHEGIQSVFAPSEENVAENETLLSLDWRRSLSSLRAKLIVPYVLLTLLTAMVGTYVVTRLVTSSVRERFVNQLYEASRVAADGFVRKERSHLANLRLIAFTEGVSEAMLAGDSNTLQRIIEPLVFNNDIEATTLVDLTGRELLTLARDTRSGSLDYLISRDMDLSGYAPIQRVLRGESDPLGDKFASLLTTDRGTYLFNSAPVRDISGQLVGVLMVGSRLETILAELNSQALADLVILDSGGNLLATTFPEPDEGFAVLELSVNGEQVFDPVSLVELRVNNRRYQAAYAPLYVRQEAVGILGVVLPTNYIVDTEATSRDRLSAFFSIATVGVIIVGYFLAQSIARPILRLRAMSQAVAAGDLNQRTHLKRSDEIGELARAFDVMTYRLRRRTAQAARLYAETVRRNEELAAANQRLQATQQQLIQSEKLAAVGQLTAGIVHDVKNPLAVIKGMAEELQEDPGLSQDAREQLRTVRDNAARANTIVTDLLKFARQSQPEFRHQDLRETVQSAIRLSAYLARKAQVNVKLDAPLSPVMVSYDASQLEQVLINLMQNAIQAMPDGGQLQLTLTPGNGAVRLVVRDSGIGIPKDHLNRIFDPFFTTKPPGEGTGLGLSVSYGIVSRHRGRIEVQSMPGKGTAFTILLPIEQPSAQHAGIG